MNKCMCGKPTGLKRGTKVYKTYCSNQCRLKYQNSRGYGVNLGKKKV